MPIFACIYRVIVINIRAHAMIIMLQVLISSSESGLSDEHDPMEVVSDDEIAPEPEVFTSDMESDPNMISDNGDGFQPFALPDFGDDIPGADILIDDVFALPSPVHEQLIIGHPDSEHIVAPILDVLCLSLISLDSSLHSVADSVDSMTYSALGAAGHQLHATDVDNDAMSAAPLSPVRAPTPPHVPDPDPIPFGLPLVAPLIPEPASAPLDLPPVDPLVPQSPPVDVVPLQFVSDEHRADLPIVFLREILAPRQGEGTSGQPSSFDPFAAVDFPPILQFPPLASSPFNEPFGWFPPYTMPIPDPYHPSHHAGYTRDELLLSLQLQFEILSHRVLELEFDEGARRSAFPFHPTSVPPPSSSASFVPPPTAPTSIPGFDARFLTVEQQITFAFCSFSLLPLFHRQHRRIFGFTQVPYFW
ncbi:hypothetical protein Hdeb2414_s0002g00063971 [Helianthus debilis subsp. tardiflorus]